MKGLFIQTTLHGKEALMEIIKSGILGTDSKPLGSQPLQFKDRPLSFCSYVCEGYMETYGNRQGIAFETDSPIIYACPADSFELMRAGNWLPGHEKFIFPSIEAMLEKYPTSEHFKKDFQEYFRILKPKKVYPKNTLDFARMEYETDYCLETIHPWNPGCNEITFPKQVKIKNCRIFESKAELMHFLD